MSQSRIEWKVGLFVLVSLVLLAGLIMRFSKGASIFTKTYPLSLVTTNVGGIIPGAAVLMAGVPIGSVQEIDLDSRRNLVRIQVELLGKYPVPTNSLFAIQTTGFLGDQIISVTPNPGDVPMLAPGSTVPCQAPFEIQEVARTGGELIQKLDQTAVRLDGAIARIDRTLLSEETLIDLTLTVENFRRFSEGAVGTLRNVDQLVEANSHPLTATVSNMATFTDELSVLGRELASLVKTNRAELREAMQNLKATTGRAEQIMADLQAGQGVVGALLYDEELAQELQATISHARTLSSNLSAYGLLWKPEFRRTNWTKHPLYPGKDPFH